LVQVLHKYGLNPLFKTNLNKWSKDLHCVVRFLKKIPQTDDEKKRAQECVDILFKPKKIEHYGSFIRCEHGMKMNFKNMTNFAIPLVILTWHRMIQEYFWKHDNKTFFHYGNYSEQKKRGPKNGLDNLYMINSLDVEEKNTSFDMIRPNSDADVSKEACQSLLEWANYLLEPYAVIDNNDDSELNNANNLKGPVQSYKLTDDEIKWKKRNRHQHNGNGSNCISSRERTTME
jgi:hypothetical protein